MSRTAVVTGTASGIGRAVAERLRADGDRVIGVDLHDADITVDLTTAEGRAAMVEQATSLSGGTLHAVVACAGVSGRTNPTERVVRLNFFGAVATLDGLRPLLVPGSAAVAIASNAAFTPAVDEAAVALCLAGAEDDAATHAYAAPVVAYATAKRALVRWVRHQAVGPAWVGAGIRLNAVAPGVVVTGMTEADLPRILATPGYPRPTAEPGRPEEIAALVRFLLGEEARYLVGAVIVADGGTDAALRPDL